MPSPILPDVPDTGTLESRALSPSMKIFAATTIIVGGAAVAAAFWKASLDFGVIDSDIHSVIDRSFTTAPLPNFPLSPNTVSDQPATGNHSGNVNQETALAAQSVPATALPVLPALSQTPAVDSGNKKYAQKYQPPVIIEPVQQSSEKISATDKKTGNDKPITQSTTRFEPIHKISVPVSTVPTSTAPAVTSPSATIAPSVTNNDPFKKIEKKPPTIPSSDTNDEMLSLFQFADNFEPTINSKTESKLPENPFLTASTSEEAERGSRYNSDLLPLHLSDSPQSKESLLPLKSTEIPLFQLQPLKIITHQEPKI
ncbi:MAG: hypothetical protein LBI18_15875 [Planctomycetaceae bacterium]|jgi:hypothetical protein|nr:hypothetical protein [Planctomycetaceae bacterium]